MSDGAGPSRRGPEAARSGARGPEAALLELRGLNKRFGALTVTDDVWFSVKPGEIHAIIGPNGAGKTTLIGQMSGDLAPDSGHIFFDGHDVTRQPMARRAHHGLARSFQITNILPGFTVLENVALAVQAHDGHSFRFFGDASQEVLLNAKAIDALARVGLEGRLTVPARTLSHGEKRALEIAIALAIAPKMLLLDEPMAGMGREETSTMVETLRGLRGRYTMVLVEHDMDAVFALADRISVLVYGRIIATGTPEEIRGNPEVRAAYLGEEDPTPAPTPAAA